LKLTAKYATARWFKNSSPELKTAAILRRKEASDCISRTVIARKSRSLQYWASGGIRWTVPALFQSLSAELWRFFGTYQPEKIHIRIFFHTKTGLDGPADGKRFKAVTRKILYQDKINFANRQRTNKGRSERPKHPNHTF